MNFARQRRASGQPGPIRAALGLNWLIALLASGGQCRWLAAAASQQAHDSLANLLINRQELGHAPHQEAARIAANSRWVPVAQQPAHANAAPPTTQAGSHEEVVLHQLNAAASLQSLRPGSIIQVSNDQAEAKPVEPTQISLEKACDKQVKLLVASSEPASVKRVMSARQAPAIQRASEPSRQVASRASHNRSAESFEEETDDDDDEDDDHEQDAPGAGTRPTPPAKDQLTGNESVSHESAMLPPPPPEVDEDGQLVESRQSPSGGAGGDNDEDESPSSDNGPEGGGPETSAEEMAARREQEAAEASEAEAADRSALAEQQQAQREIILAQAQSEAKAIREQQEALLKQQQMQQQILMQRTQNLLSDDHAKRGRAEKRARTKQHQRAASERRRQDGPPVSLSQGQQHRRAPTQTWPPGGGLSSEPPARMMDSTSRARERPSGSPDNQFSDQLENGIVDRGMESASSSAQLQQQQRRDNNFNQAQHRRQQQQQRRSMQERQSGHADRAQLELPSSPEEPHLGEPAQMQPDGDELGGDYSMRQLQHVQLPGDTAKRSVEPTPAQPTSPRPVQTGARLNLTTSDLQAAAQHHHYGAHYGSLGGHHKGAGKYYQFAESHKKGQFETGFKRGNKKFSIAAHSSQHKGHAEGHVKWHAKKGKGTHYWDYQHKNKKHYGAGHAYGAGHYFY